MQTITKFFILTIHLLLISGSLIAQKSILVYTRTGEGYVHDNIQASVEALQKIGREEGYKVSVSDNPAIFTNDSLQQFDCIIFSNTNNETFLTDAQRQSFKNYIQSGGGFMGIHSASTSEREWPWFWRMLGGKFVRHPELQTFTVKVIDQRHPATDFMENIWEWNDECYFLNQLNPDIHILLVADLRSIEDDQKDNYPGNVFGNYTPLAWCHEFEGGRQFYTALGHKKEHYQNPFFLNHISGGIKWVIQEK